MMFLSDEQILEYADKYSKCYIAKYGESVFVSKDDAYSIAFIALSENSSYDENCSKDEIESLLRIRVIGAITRHYQDMNGIRRKNRVSFVPFDVCESEIAKKRAKDGDIAVRETIDFCLSRISNEDKKDVIKAILNGEKKSDVAKRTGLSCGRISQIFQEFKDNVSRLL